MNPTITPSMTAFLSSKTVAVIVALSELSDFTLICDVDREKDAGTVWPVGTEKCSTIGDEVSPPEEAVIFTVSFFALISLTSHVAVPSLVVVVTGGLIATRPVFPVNEKVTPWLLIG